MQSRSNSWEGRIQTYPGMIHDAAALGGPCGQQWTFRESSSWGRVSLRAFEYYSKVTVLWYSSVLVPSSYSPVSTVYSVQDQLNLGELECLNFVKVRVRVTSSSAGTSRDQHCGVSDRRSDEVGSKPRSKHVT